MADGSRKYFWRQLFVVSGAIMNVVNTGCAVGYTGVLLPQLMKESSNIRPTHEEGSWIASTLAVSMIVSLLLMPHIMDRFGRRFLHFIAAIPSILSWILIVLAPNIATIIIARLLQGFTVGIVGSLAPIIIGEYTSPKNRGGYLGTISASIAAGMFLVHLFGLFFNWRITAMFCSMFSITALIIVFLSPETPGWYASKRRFEECDKSFRYLRGESEADINELKAMIEAQKDGLRQSLKSAQDGTICERYLLKFKAIYKPVIINTVMFLTMHFSGLSVMPAYSIFLLTKLLSISEEDAYKATVIIDLVRVISASISLYIITKMPRRFVWFMSSVMSFVVLLGLSVFPYLKSMDIYEIPNVCMIVLICVYVFVTYLGLSSITWTICGEILPLEHKTFGTTVVGIIAATIFLIALKTAPPIALAFGIHVLYFAYAMSVLVFNFYLYFNLPETKGRTLQEIEGFFNKSNVNNVSNEKDVELDKIFEKDDLQKIQDDSVKL